MYLLRRVFIVTTYPALSSSPNLPMSIPIPSRSSYVYVYGWISRACSFSCNGVYRSENCSDGHVERIPGRVLDILNR